MALFICMHLSLFLRDLKKRACHVHTFALQQLRCVTSCASLSVRQCKCFVSPHRKKKTTQYFQLSVRPLFVRAYVLAYMHVKILYSNLFRRLLLHFIYTMRSQLLVRRPRLYLCWFWLPNFLIMLSCLHVLQLTVGATVGCQLAGTSGKRCFNRKCAPTPPLRLKSVSAMALCCVCDILPHILWEYLCFYVPAIVRRYSYIQTEREAMF